MKHTMKEKKQDIKKSDAKPTLSLSSFATKIRKYIVPGVDSVDHISGTGKLWVSDLFGNLVLSDLQGKQLQKIKTNGKHGYHTVTQTGELIYTYRKNKVVNKIKEDNTITKFIETGDWAPISIYSSHINGDILMGLKTNTLKMSREAKVIRYNKTGKELQNIERDEEEQKMYSDPHYIT